MVKDTCPEGIPLTANVHEWSQKIFTPGQTEWKTDGLLTLLFNEGESDERIVTPNTDDPKAKVNLGAGVKSVRWKSRQPDGSPVDLTVLIRW